MNNKKYIVCIVLLIALLLQGCPSQRVVRIHPTSQKGSVWISEDGSFVFTVGDEAAPDFIPAVVYTDGKQISLSLGMGVLSTHIAICVPDAWDEYGCPVEIAYGNGNARSIDKYVITIFDVCSDNTPFEPGEKIVFHKVDTDITKAPST